MYIVSPFLKTDCYKVGHPFQYPKNTVTVYSNNTPRKSRIPGINKTVFFGLQAFIKEYLIKDFDQNFFSLPEEKVINDYKEVIESMLGPEAITYEHIRALHKLGYLPIRIKALPEGSLVPMRVPALTIVNTKPEFYWLTNFFETIMSSQLWQASTSATLAYEYKKLLVRYANETSTNLDFVNWQGHDFSFRGMSSYESATLSGAGHLLSFTGTDTIPSIPFFIKYYNAKVSDLIGGSVAATEHSVMCAGEKDSEIETFKRLITEVYPIGIVSIVSDTWDLWKVLIEYMPQLKEVIETRDGKVVIRPDSGNPVDIIAGLNTKENILNIEGINLNNYEEYLEDMAYDYLKCGQGYYNDIWEPTVYIGGKLYKATVLAEIGSSKQDRGDRLYSVENIKSITLTELEQTPQMKGVVELLYDVFGGTVNSKGYIELNAKVGAIYGDSITLERAEQICKRLKNKGFASTNIVFGIGSYTYQYNTRDTFGWATKATYVEVKEKIEELVTNYDGTYTILRDQIIGREIFKDPITDDGTKKSAKGLLQVYKDENGDYALKDQCTWEEEALGELEIVFEDGRLVKETNLNEIRNRLKV